VAEEQLKIRAAGVDTSPLRCFLEVLILNDFKSLFPEVLIPGDFKSFVPEVLILVELKSFRMNMIGETSQLQRWFVEVLILVGLRRRFSEVLILQGLGVRDECRWATVRSKYTG
jgi:hypothetical protein